jgi:hypothetical protein
MRLGSVLVLAGALALALPASGRAQVRPSEAATISQTVDGTTITLTYSRPQARGRDSVFGKVVHYGRIWTPGANWATTLEASADVRVNGHPVPKGKYSVWAIPGATEWTIVLDPEAKRFHTQRPGESDDQLRFTAAVDSGSHTEVLTWDFPVVRPDGATMRLRWGTVVVPLDVAVRASGRGRLPGTALAYVGTYRLRFSGPRAESGDHRADVFEEDSVLHLRLTPNPFPEYDPVVVLHASAEPRTFRPVFAKDGRVVDAEADARVVFSVEHGIASSLELRSAGDRVMATGTREQ